MAKLVLLLVFVCFQFSKSEDLPAIEQIKLDLDEDEVPFNNQTGPDTEMLDGADEDQWSPRPKFKFPSDEEALNNTHGKERTILDKLLELAELISENSDDFSDEFSDEYSDEDFSFDWDDDFFDDDDDDDDYEYDPDFSYWDAIKDWIYSAKYKESVKNKNGKEYVRNRMISLLRPKNPKGDKAGDNLGKGLHPVKRFTSV